MSDQVLIFDTTLRDGEQSPGATMSHNEKLEIATLLDEMGVDIIEAGFPIASEGDFEAVSEIAKNSKNSVICGLAPRQFQGYRPVYGGGETRRTAAHPHLYRHLAVAPRHHGARYGRHGRQNPRDRDPCAQPVRQRAMVADGCDPHRTRLSVPRRGNRDQGRGDHDQHSPIPSATPFRAKVRILSGCCLSAFPGADEIVFATHCHNDLGMATANSLAAVEAGARQIECTINGLGRTCGAIRLSKRS